MNFSDFCRALYVRRAPLGSQTKFIHARFKNVGGTCLPDTAYAKKIFSRPNPLSQNMLSSVPETLPRESFEAFLREHITNTADGSAGLLSRCSVNAVIAGLPTTLDIDPDAFIPARADWFIAIIKSPEDCDILATAYQHRLEGESAPATSSFTPLCTGDKVIVSRPPGQQDYSEPFWSELSHDWFLQKLETVNWTNRSLICTNPKDNGVRPSVTGPPVPDTPPRQFAKVSVGFESRGREGKATRQWTLINVNDQNCFPYRGDTVRRSCHCCEHRGSEI